MTARQLALRILREDRFTGDALHLEIDSFDLSEADRRFTVQLVLGVTENRLLFDYYISALSSVRLSKIDPEILAILRMGLYQIMRTDVPDFAAVNESTALAKKLRKPHLERFVNAVLRSFLRRRHELPFPEDPLENCSVLYSHPRWIIEMWADAYGPDFARELAAANQVRPPLSLRVNHRLISRAEYRSKLAERGIRARYSEISESGLLVDDLAGVRVRGLPGYGRGEIIVQDESSQQVVHLWRALGSPSSAPDGRKEWTAVDVCSAPGGKATHLMEYAQRASKAKVYAFDISPRKLITVADHVERLGLSDVASIGRVDATRPRPDLFGRCDLVLVDAPCSGLGIIRKKPEIRYNRTPSDIDSLVELQKTILAESSKYAKIGANLIYSTCTISPRENRYVVDHFVREAGCFRLRAEQEYFPHIHGSDGFYIALLEKMDESSS